MGCGCLLIRRNLSFCKIFPFSRLHFRVLNFSCCWRIELFSLSWGKWKDLSWVSGTFLKFWFLLYIVPFFQILFSFLIHLLSVRFRINQSAFVFQCWIHYWFLQILTIFSCFKIRRVAWLDFMSSLKFFHSSKQ